MAKLRYRSLSRRTVDKLSGGGKDVIFWDPELVGFGVRVYPSGTKVYLVQSRGPGGSKRVTVGRHGMISADEARRRAAVIIARITSGGESESAPNPAHRCRAHGGRARREISPRARGGALQAEYGPGVPPGDREASVAVARQAAGGRARARARRGDALPAPQDARRRERGGRGPVTDAQPGRGLGSAPGGRQSLPFRVPVPDAPAGAIPDRGGVSPPWRSARCAGSRRAAAGARGGGPQAADADRVPVKRDHDLAMGGRAPRSARAPASRQQDGPARDSPVAVRGVPGCWRGFRASRAIPSRLARSVGHRGPQTGLTIPTSHLPQLTGAYYWYRARGS